MGGTDRCLGPHISFSLYLPSLSLSLSTPFFLYRSPSSIFNTARGFSARKINYLGFTAPNQRGIATFAVIVNTRNFMFLHQYLNRFFFFKGEMQYVALQMMVDYDDLAKSSLLSTPQSHESCMINRSGNTIIPLSEGGGEWQQIFSSSPSP